MSQVSAQPISIRPRPAWKPIPNTSQEYALRTKAQIVFYHGGRGPGKTDTQLMRFFRKVGQGYGPYWRGIILDREYKMLGDIVAKSKRHFGGRDKGGKFLSSTADYKWVWPTGEELLFRQAKKDEDYWNYHGQEFPFIGWNEICKYPTPDLFDKMLSCNRSSFTPDKDGPIDANGTALAIPPIPLEVFITGNPYGPGHNWVKRRFIDPAPDCTIVRKRQRVFNPQVQQDEDIELTQVAVFGSPRENIYLDKQYMAQLENTKDVNQRKAWLYGDWDIVAGGALDDVWNPAVQVRRRFKVPVNWRMDRSFDWGSTHPAACIWWAEADGTSARMPDGTLWTPRRGSIIAFDELYFHDPDRDNAGLKYGAGKIAEMIRDREMLLMNMGAIPSQPWPGPADNQIRDVRNSEQDTIAEVMRKVGITWTESDKGKGSRINGLQLVRDRLQASTDWAETGDARGPGLYFMNNCRMTIATVPILPRDEDNPDDVDTEAEDHLYDAVRYRCLAAGHRYATNISFIFPH